MICGAREAEHPIFAARYLEYSKAQKKSWERDEATLKHANRFFGNMTLDEIGGWHIDKYRMERSRSAKKATVNRELDTIRNLFNKAIEWGSASRNPITKDKRFRVSNQRIRYLGPEEVNSLVEACPLHLKPIVQLALATGMRKSEITTLRWDQVNLREGIIHIEQSKSDRRREISIGSRLTSLLGELKLNSKGSKVVFTRPDGKPVGNFRKAFKNAVQRAGIHDFRFHDCRHHAASIMVMGGLDLVTVKEILGHASLDMVLRYTHLSPRHRREAAKLIDTYMDTSGKIDHEVIDVSNKNY